MKLFLLKLSSENIFLFPLVHLVPNVYAGQPTVRLKECVVTCKIKKISQHIYYIETNFKRRHYTTIFSGHHENLLPKKPQI